MHFIKSVLNLRSMIAVSIPALFLIACHLGDEEKVEATISFNQIYDSLVLYDSVLITLKDKGGNTIDVVFRGKVDEPADIENRPAPHWNGGDIVVSIIGYKKDVSVYRSESNFNGNTNKKDSVYVFVAPGISITASQTSIPMLEGDSIPLPRVTITPANLKIKDLNWVSSAPDVIRIGISGFKALKAGNALITVSLIADPTKTMVLTVVVADPAKILESLALSADTLKLSAGGASGRLEVVFVPSTAAKDVHWSIIDTNIATVAADGTVKGVLAGETRLIATSSLKASAKDTAVVMIANPQPPDQVVFAKAETEIFVGGAAELLQVSILPPEANQEVDFTVTALTNIGLENGRISGLAQGEGSVIAASHSNPLLKDTLKVRVSVKQVVTSVTLSKKTLVVFTGGDQPVLTVAIEPATSNQKVQWRADKTGTATVSDAGKVIGVSPGHTRIHAISLVDSTKQDSADVTVRTDAPVVNIGRPDTTVSVGASVTFLPIVPVQEYGVVVAFRWDVNGTAGWDDTAKAVQGVPVKFDVEKDYLLRFYVRDTEGNETIVTKKVSAVIGPVVTIISPANGAYVNTAALKIEWKIDNLTQTTGTDTVLKEGANVITRSAKDAAGKVFSTLVTVYLDTEPPAKPFVKGPTGIAHGKPTWTWSTGGGGNGIFRIAVDSQVFAGAGSRDTLLIPDPALIEGSHTLYVQERDAAGNWSLPGKINTAVDVSGPVKPIVKNNVTSPSREKRPKWTWSSGGGGSGIYQFKFNSSDFTTGASVPSTDTVFIPGNDLGDATHTLYVRERDSIGNWSEIGNSAIVIDTTAPGAPKFVLATSPTSSAPYWTWISGGGSGIYKFKVGGEPNASPEVTVKEYAQPAPLTSKTTYILFVQERDAAGNWSPVANASVFYDLSKPSVTITSPIAQIAGTYLTKAGTVDLAGLSWSPQGTSGSIKSIIYTVDGIAGTLSTNLAGDGGWNIKALVLSNNKTIVVKVTARDVADNTGEATLNILWDNTAPNAPAFIAQPISPLKNGDVRNGLTWTWGEVASADSFVVKMNGTEVSRQTGYSYTIQNFPDGTYTLEVSSKDMTGNASVYTSSAPMVVDRVLPNTPLPTVTETPTRNNTPTWTWSSSGGTGNFEYRIALGSAPTGSGAPIASINYKPTSALADGTWYFQVREKDAADNWSAWSASSSVVIKFTKPNAPSVFRNATPTNQPKWTWSSGGGGNATFQYRWSGNPSYLGEGLSKEYTPDISDGSYNLCVSERDIIGYGNETCLSITVDKTGPEITAIKSKDWGFALKNGFITNKPTISISFEADKASKETSCDLKDGDSKDCPITATDNLGNPTTVYLKVWHRSKVVFVKSGGTGDGSSWENAMNSLADAATDPANKGFQVWVGSDLNKTYPSLKLTQDITILTGFNVSNSPVDSTSRVKWNNKIEQISARDAIAIRAEGFIITYGPNAFGAMAVFQEANAMLVDCKFEISSPNFVPWNILEIINSVKLTLKNVTMEDQVVSSNLIYCASYSELTIDGGKIFSNESGGAAIYIGGDLKTTLKGKLQISENYVSNPELTGIQIMVADAGTLTLVGGNIVLDRRFIKGPYNEEP